MSSCYDYNLVIDSDIYLFTISSYRESVAAIVFFFCFRSRLIQPLLIKSIVSFLQDKKVGLLRLPWKEESYKNSHFKFVFNIFRQHIKFPLEIANTYNKFKRTTINSRPGFCQAILSETHSLYHLMYLQL